MRKQKEQKVQEKPRPETRVNSGMSILPSLQARLIDQARREDKSASRLIEVLCTWALDQLDQNQISSYELKTWSAVPPPSSRYFQPKNGG